MVAVALDDLWNVKQRVPACMCLTRVLGQTSFLTGGLWHFFTCTVFNRPNSVWVGGCVYHSNLDMERTSDLKALCLVRKPLEWDNVLFWNTL